MSKWFECKVRYNKIVENGAQKKVTEIPCGRSLLYGG